MEKIYIKVQPFWNEDARVVFGYIKAWIPLPHYSTECPVCAKDANTAATEKDGWVCSREKSNDKYNLLWHSGSTFPIYQTLLN